MRIKRILLFALLLLASANSAISQQSIHFTPEELTIWKQRAGITSGEKLYNTYGDANPGSPADWQRIISTANEFRRNPAVDRYSNYYKGSSCYPTEQKNGWTWKAIDAFQPKEKSDYLVNAAFVYLLNGDESYAQPVRDEIMAYTRIPNLDASNRNVFCTDSKNNVDDFNNFFLAVWYSKMLFAYDCTKSSAAWSATDRARVKEWLMAAANYYKVMENNDFSKMIPGRENGNYSLIANYLNEVGWNGGGRSDGKRTHQNGPEVYNLSRKYNNRRTNMVKFYFSVGVYFDDNALITNGIRFYKEYMAYGMLTESCIQADMYRGGGNSPEVGYNYSWICISDMVEMADFYARKFDSSLFDYSLNDEDFNKFFSGHSNKGWYKDLAIKGKTLEKAIDNHFKYLDGTYASSRTFGGQPIDGKTVVYDRFNNAKNAFWMYHTWMGRANIYYQNEDWKSIYTGQKANTAYPISPDIAHGPGIYWDNPWVGVLHNYPGFLFMWGRMEGKVWPYTEGKESQTISFTNINNRFFEDGSFELSATSSSGLPVSFEVVSGPAFVNGNIINFTGAGEVVVRAYQQGDDKFRAVNESQSFSIKKKIEINQVENQIVRDGSTTEVDVDINYSGDNSGSLNFTAVSENTAVIDNSNITVTGNGENWKIIIQTPQGVEGNVKITLNAQDASTEADPISFNVLVGLFNSSILRIDAGLASGQSTYDSKVFEPLLPYLVEGEGRNSTEVRPIANTNFDELYHSETWGRSDITKYAIPVNQGDYSVHLHFSDWHYDQPGDRVMDILLENELVLDDFDIIGEVGKSAAIIKSFDLVIMDGSLNLEIRNVEGFSEIAAIEILPQGTPSIAVDKPDAFNQVIDFKSLGLVTLPDSPITLEATASSGLPVTFELISGEATLNGNELTFSELGIVTVKASQAGDESYLPADDVLRTFRVTEKISLASLSDKIIAKNATLGPLRLEVDYSGDIDDLTIVVDSENKELIPDENIILKREGDNFTLTLTPGTDLTGVGNMQIEISDNYYAKISRSFNILVEEGLSSVNALRLDGGLETGESFYEGKKFEPLLPYLENGTAYSTYAYWAEDILNTTNDGLYQTEIWWEQDSTLSFEFPLAPGEYTVHFHFIDLYTSQVGEKLLDVKLQDVTVLNNYDIMLEASVEQAVIKSFDVTIAKGNLKLTLFSELGFNQISGIEILPRGEAPLQITTPLNVVNNIPIIQDIDEPIIQEGATATILVNAEDSDNEPLTLTIQNLPKFATFTDEGAGEGKIVVSPGYQDAGEYTATLIATDARGGESRLAFSIDVVDLPLELKISSFTLVNADTEEVLGSLSNGDTIRYAEIGTDNINIRAEVEASIIDRVEFSINEINTSSESIPFNLFNTNNSNIKSFSAIGGNGLHKLEAVPIMVITPDNNGEERIVNGEKLSIDFYLDTTIPDFDVDIYPNPSDEIFNVNLNRWSEKGMYLAVYDGIGKVYIENKLDPSQRDNLSLKLNDTQFRPGIYLVKIFSGDGNLSIVKRIMKASK